MRIFEVPEGSKQSKGRAIVNLINLEGDDKVLAYIPVLDLKDEEYVNGNHYGGRTPGEAIKLMMSKLQMRDGFKVSTGISYVIEDWNHTRFALGDVRETANRLQSTMTKSKSPFASSSISR